MNNKSSIKFLAQGAVIAAIYVALTFVSSMFGLSGGAVQLRLSEALCVLPSLSPAAVPGLFVGCILANTLTGSIFTDIIFGSLATLIGAVLTRRLKKHPVLCLVPPIAANTVILPLVLKFSYSFQGSYLFFAATIFASEVLSCGVLGYLFGKILDRYKKFF